MATRMSSGKVRRIYHHQGQILQYRIQLPTPPGVYGTLHVVPTG